MNDQAAEQSLQALAADVPKGTAPGHLAVQFQHAGFLKLPSPQKRTYDELISTGNIGLLRDQGAKSALADYHGQFNELRQWDELLREQRDAIGTRGPVCFRGQSYKLEYVGGTLRFCPLRSMTYWQERARGPPFTICSSAWQRTKSASGGIAKPWAKAAVL